MKDPIASYLQRYAETQIAELSLPDIYQHSLVIPAFKEEKTTLQQVWQHLVDARSVLVILVINSHAPEDATAHALDNALRKNRTLIWQKESLSLLTHTTEPDLLVVDCYSAKRTIPAKQGVGLARKIGCDLALQAHHIDAVGSDWIATTDADVILPPSYFAAERRETDAATIYPFKHLAKEGTSLAVQLFEIQMLYYIVGLISADSSYAYPSIGSAISCRANDYARVRGFPRKNATEDFYLLNKLRKIGDVRVLDKPWLQVSGRSSKRVPVGSGRKIDAIRSSGLRLEHPDCFAKLKDFLKHLDWLAEQQPASAASTDNTLQALVTQSGLEAHYLTKQNQEVSSRVMRKHLIDWFDGLKTRQLIHYLRDEHFGTIEVTELHQSGFVSTSEPAGIISEFWQQIIQHHQH